MTAATSCLESSVCPEVVKPPTKAQTCRVIGQTSQPPGRLQQERKGLRQGAFSHGDHQGWTSLFKNTSRCSLACEVLPRYLVLSVVADWCVSGLVRGTVSADVVPSRRLPPPASSVRRFQTRGHHICPRHSDKMRSESQRQEDGTNRTRTSRLVSDNDLCEQAVPVGQIGQICASPSDTSAPHLVLGLECWLSFSPLGSRRARSRRRGWEYSSSCTARVAAWSIGPRPPLAARGHAR